MRPELSEGRQEHYDLRAPFPWFGGKSIAAPLIWSVLGDVANYVEPFLGSAAVLLARPGSHAAKIETVNDADGLLSNLWRAVAADPEAVAAHADWPVSECDLSARHLWLVRHRGEITERLQVDPEWYDVRAAGWWVWGICSWIGSGWCSGEGPWSEEGGRWVLRTAGQGINRQLPHLGDAGRGIHNQDLGRGSPPVVAWLQALAARLRRVRICCGDWARVCTPSVTHRHGLTGVFLDPPYPEAEGEGRGLGADVAYTGQDGSASDLWRAVVAWAEEHGARADMRIVLAGYEGAGDPPKGWRSISWSQKSGYGATATTDNGNRHRERLWCSPACLDLGATRGEQLTLLGGAR